VSNYKLLPRTNADRERIVNWANQHKHPIESERDADGAVVFGFDSNDLRSATIHSSLKQIAVYGEAKLND